MRITLVIKNKTKKKNKSIYHTKKQTNNNTYIPTIKISHIDI